MSEYQYFEWQTVNRLLTQAEQDAVRHLSSHIEVSGSRAIVTYSWGDFKHDPRQVLVRFFDAHLYMANWGSRRLMYRFPARSLSRETIEPYCVRDQITCKTLGGFDVLDLDLSEEEGGAWIEGEGALSDLIPLWNDILQGDHRLLYLAWLKAMSIRGDEPPDDRKSSVAKSMEPAVPPGLRQLSPALKQFLNLFEVPPCLVEAAAEVSLELEETSGTNFYPLVAQLSRNDCDGFLCRFAGGDTAAGMELKKRLLSLMPCKPAAQPVRLSIGQLLKRADAIENERKRRRAEQARRKHTMEMKALASCETETWQEVEVLVGLKQSKHYAAAVQLLVKLRELAEFQNLKADFWQRLEGFCGRYSNRPGFKWRVEQAKLFE